MAPRLPDHPAWTGRFTALCLILALPLSLLGSVGSALTAVWTNVNPGGGGAFTCAAAGPTGTIVIGSDIAGAYRSTDRGTTWTNIGYLNGGLRQSYVSAIAFDPAAAGIFYLAGEGGLYRSADGGSSFSPRMSGGFWSAIAVAPSDPRTAYAARHSAYDTTDPRIYRSSDRGLSWALAGALPAGTRVLKLAVRPNDPAQLFAVSGYEALMSGAGEPRRALYVSVNGGATWADAHGDSTNRGMTGNPWDAAYDPEHPDTIFATSVVSASNPDVSSSWSGYAWRGRQAGGIWDRLSSHTGAIVARRGPPGGPATVTTIDVGRGGPGCSECGSFTSSDGGATWFHTSDMTGWDTAWNGDVSWSYSAATTGVCKTLGQDLSAPQVLCWVTPQFAWMSTDAGASFARLFTDQPAPGYWKSRGLDNVAPAALSASGGMLYAGFYDLGIWRSLDGGASWQPSNDAGFTGAWSGKGGQCMTILADPARPQVVWASQGEDEEGARLIRSSTSGTPGSWATTSGLPSGYINGLSLDLESAVGARTLYVTSNGDVYKSANDGLSWNRKLACGACYSTAARGSTVLAGGENGLWRSLDGGTTWGETNPGIFHMDPSGDALKFAQWHGPHDIMIAGPAIYVADYGSGRGLYRSTDAGASWTRIVADDYARTIHRDAFGALYFGSSSATSAGGDGTAGASGIQVSTDAGATWSSLTSGLAWPFVWPIATVPSGGSRVMLFVGLPGSGFFRSLVAAGLPVAVEPTRSGGLRVAGFRPNPAGERVTVAFTLATSAPAVLEVLDVAGRRLVRREVGGMGPGDHLLLLGPAFRPTPGVYIVRLVQGARIAHATSVVVR